MSCNYYAHILPNKESKKEFYDAVKNNDFPLTRRLVKEMYGHLELDFDTSELIGGEVHLGKRSAGWKFLWNPNLYVRRNGHNEKGVWVTDPSIPIYLYPLTRDGIKSFISRQDVLIYDEYVEPQDKEEFWNMALSWGYDDARYGGEEGFDSASYIEFKTKSNPNFPIYRVSTELTDMIKNLGYTFISEDQSDFYADGLRFSTSTEFC